MQKLLVTLGFFFTAAVASAAPGADTIYDIKIELSLGGKRVASPRIITRDGSRASVTETDTTTGESAFVEVVPTASSKNERGIFMTFIVGKIGKNGERIEVGRPQIIARENQRAEITVEDDKGGEELRLSVLATEKR